MDGGAVRVAGLFLAGALLAAGSAPAAPSDRSVLRIELAPTGAGPDASGLVRGRLRVSRSDRTVKLKGLTLGASDEVRTDGVLRATVVARSNGSARVRFRTPDPRPRDLGLDFDPRGATLTVGDGSADVLSAVLSGPGEPPGSVVDERTFLQPTALAPGGRAEARFRLRRDGRRRFEVEIEDVPPGDYELFVDGVLRGTIAVGAGGEGEIEFDTNPEPGKVPLDFDPRGATVDVARGPDVFFTGPAEAQAPGVNVCAFSESEVFVPAAGAGGRAKARIRTRDDCDRDFRVEIEDVPVGGYELFVGGVLRGTIDVAFDPSTGENEGQIEFDTDPDDPGDRLLDFDPVGQTVEIVQGGTVFFSSVFDPADPGAQTCTPVEDTVLLAGTAAAPVASGEARHRVRDDCDRDYRVQVEDLPEGTYDLVVGGVVRAQIPVAFDPAEGQNRGEVEFDTADPGKLPLDFDPTGQTVEIVQGGVVLASSAGAPPGGGDPPGGGGPGTCTEDETQLPLLQTGALAGATGDVRLRLRDDCRESLRVQVEDVPDGGYDLRVGGTVRGSIQVSLGQGQLEFDTDDPPKPVLDFPVRGELVEVLQGGTAVLQRVFPE